MIKVSVVVIFLVILMTGCQSGTSQNPQEVRIEEETWDLLWVSDSSGWGVADIYGEYIAEDNNVEVNVIDSWQGGLSAGSIL